MSNTIDWYNLIASERGLPDGWKWNKLEAVGPDVIVTGAVCNVVFKSGPRKGAENWSKRDKTTARKIIITREQLRDRQAVWERDTGKCYVCQGSGQEFSGWSRADGRKTKPCVRCESTGEAPKETP